MRPGLRAGFPLARRAGVSQPSSGRGLRRWGLGPKLCHPAGDGTAHRKGRASALPDRAATGGGGAQKEENTVDMLRVLPMRVYIAYTSLRDREEGQALVEYALLLALVAIVSIGILTTLGGSVSKVFSKINADLP